MILENIYALCKKNGISVFALEKAVGIGNGTIARWGKSSPRVDRLQSVAKYFGVTVDDLLCESEAMMEERR